MKRIRIAWHGWLAMWLHSGVNLGSFQNNLCLGPMLWFNLGCKSAQEEVSEFPRGFSCAARTENLADHRQN